MQSDAANPSLSLMAREAAEAPQAVRSFLQNNRTVLMKLAQELRDDPPSVVVTCARGSSDNAATYAKYLIETMAGVPVSSSALSVSSVFGAEMQPGRVLVIAISQSGRSPDLLAAVEAHRRAGARVVALVNDETAPLADLAHWVLPLHAGPEKSVAATKSYIASLAGVAALVAHWTGDAPLGLALERLPEGLEVAANTAPFDLVGELSQANNLFVIARGYGFGIAQEGALKLKETCALHAEAYSAAEVRHGPMTIINEGFPIVAFATSDASGESVRGAAAEFAGRGAQVALIDAEQPFGGSTLAALAGHAALEPLLMIQTFYPQVNALSLARGLDPDNPAHLRKVTETL
jgi:glucosamine--fructose-6-phosphate aminotransferase (isomerizing)